MNLSEYLVGGAAARPDSVSGFNPAFNQAVTALFSNAPPEIQQQLRLSSGYRSPERQAELYAAAVQKYGSPEAARKWVAPPGKSQHNIGHAADLKFLSPAAQEWVHANAAQYGLAFPMAHEPWHIELAGARTGGVPTQGQVAAVGQAPANALAAPMGQPMPQNALAQAQAPQQWSPQSLAQDPSAFMQRRNALPFIPYT